MKTAIQKAISNIVTLKNAARNRDVKSGLNAALILLKAQLPIEKQQIEAAYHEGQKAIFNVVKTNFPSMQFTKTKSEIEKVDKGLEPNEDAEQYYKETFCD